MKEKDYFIHETDQKTRDYFSGTVGKTFQVFDRGITCEEGSYKLFYEIGVLKSFTETDVNFKLLLDMEAHSQPSEIVINKKGGSISYLNSKEGLNVNIKPNIIQILSGIFEFKKIFQHVKGSEFYSKNELCIFKSKPIITYIFKEDEKDFYIECLKKGVDYVIPSEYDGTICYERD